MRIKMIPQVRDFDKIWYEIEDEVITATIDDVSDVFDFRGMPDGEMQMYDENDELVVETSLKEVPIVSARKESGKLSVEILFSIDSDEQDERLLFPEPMSLDEFNDLMDELEERKKEVEVDGEDGLEDE